MSDEVDELISELEDEWDLEEPLSRAELAKAAKAAPLPGELRAFFSHAGGASIGSVDVFWLDEFLDVNKRRPKTLAKAAFFASDGSDGFFFIDGGNVLKKGTRAVFWWDRSSTELDSARYCSPDLVTFLRAVANGGYPWLDG